MPAYLDWVRKICLSLPHTTEKVRWEHNLLFCIGEKMFCAANLEPGMGPSLISFKCSPEKFAELVEMDGIIPAPYSARLFWVSITKADALRQSETQELIRQAYEIVRGNLPRKLQAALTGTTGVRLPAKAASRKTGVSNKAKKKASSKKKSTRTSIAKKEASSKKRDKGKKR